jgi:hypothetical protein
MPDLLSGGDLMVLPDQDFQIEGAGVWFWNLLPFRTRCIKAAESLRLQPLTLWIDSQRAQECFHNTVYQIHKIPI